MRCSKQRSDGKVVPINTSKAFRMNGGVAPLLLKPGTSWRSVVNTCPGCFTPRETAPSTHQMGSWVGPTAGLDILEKRLIFWPCWDTNPGLSNLYPTDNTVLSQLLPIYSSATKPSQECHVCSYFFTCGCFWFLWNI